MTSRRFVAPTWSTPEGREAIALSKRSTISAPAAFWAIERFRSKGIDLTHSVALVDGLWSVFVSGGTASWERTVLRAAELVDDWSQWNPGRAATWRTVTEERPQRPSPYFPTHTEMGDPPIPMWIPASCFGVAVLLGGVAFWWLR